MNEYPNAINNVEQKGKMFWVPKCFFFFFKLSLFPFGQTGTISSLPPNKIALCLTKICFQRALILVMQGLRGKIARSLDVTFDSKDLYVRQPWNLTIPNLAILEQTFHKAFETRLIST